MWLLALGLLGGALLILAFWMSGMSVQGAATQPGIALSDGTTLNVDAGSVVQYVHTLSNTGTTTESFSIEARSLLSWTLEYVTAQNPGGTTALMPFRLAPQEATTVGLRVWVPENVRSGVVHTAVLTASLLHQGVPYTSVAVSDIAVVNPRLIYLPLVSQEHAPLFNGTFDAGLASWSTAGALDVSASVGPDDPTNPVALLGDPGYPCSAVPLGYADLRQLFTVPPAPDGTSMHLTFRYRIFSNDRNPDLDDKYDAFDVLANGERVFRDANTENFDHCNSPPFDLGWRDADIDLGEGGEWMTLAFQVHNRFDQYYNTYVYVDDVHIAPQDK
jgi:hypothetical protein